MLEGWAWWRVTLSFVVTEKGFSSFFPLPLYMGGGKIIRKTWSILPQRKIV